MSTGSVQLSPEERTASTAPQVDFVVCTRNNRDVVGGTLDAIARQDVQMRSCTVVDGLSTDGTPEFVRANYPFAKVVIKESDSGPAASRNIGMASGSAEWIVLVDSDVELSPHWAEKQIAFMEREGFDIVCGKLVYASDPSTLDAAYGAINRLTVCWNGGLGQPASAFDLPRRCLWTLSAAIAIRRSSLGELGGFDEAMFAYHEDCDLGWRANLYGYHVGFNPEAIAIHKVHSSLNLRNLGSRLTHLVCRNRIRSALVNYEAVNILRYVVPYMFLAMGDAMVRGPRWAKLNAFAWNLRHLPDTLRRRREVQSKRRVRDRELWSLFERGIRGPGYDHGFIEGGHGGASQARN